MRITIDTGMKEYEIADERGNVRGVIYVNPSDFNFLARVDAFKANITNILADTQNIDPAEETIGSVMAGYDKAVKDEVNKLFDSDVADVVFGAQNAFNMAGGLTYVERFAQAILPVIEADFKEQIEQLNNRTGKYVDQVSK